MEQSKRPSAGIITLAVGGVLALLLLGWFVAIDSRSISGDAVVGQAFEALTALGLLWLVLFGLVIVDRVLGGPSWTRRLGFLVVPVAAIASVFATDYPSNRLCQIMVLVMPLLIAAYVGLGRLPKPRTPIAQAAVLVLVAALSAYAINLFVS